MIISPIRYAVQGNTRIPKPSKHNSTPHEPPEHPSTQRASLSVSCHASSRDEDAGICCGARHDANPWVSSFTVVWYVLHLPPFDGAPLLIHGYAHASRTQPRERCKC